MKIRPSSALRNDYPAISELAKVSGEPIFITNKGEDDGVFMSMAAFEEREKMYRHRDKIYEAEMSRLRGDPVYTQEELDAMEAEGQEIELKDDDEDTYQPDRIRDDDDFYGYNAGGESDFAAAGYTLKEGSDDDDLAVSDDEGLDDDYSDDYSDDDDME